MKRYISIFLVLLAVPFILLVANIALAQSACGLRQELASKLKQAYQEIPTGIGLAKNGGVFEVFTSPEGTWTIMFTRPDGLSCLMAVGDHWETKSPDLAGLGS